MTKKHKILAAVVAVVLAAACVVHAAITSLRDIQEERAAMRATIAVAAEDEGRDAYNNGLPITANPYTTENLRLRWHNGWQRGKREGLWD